MNEKRIQQFVKYMNDYSTLHSISKSKVDCSDAVNSDGSSKSGGSGGDGSGSGTVDGFKRRRRSLLTFNVIQKNERKKENEQNVIVVGEKKEEKKKMKKKGRVVVGAESLVASKYAILKKYTKIGIIADPTTVLPLTLTHLIDQIVLVGKQNIKHQKKQI